MLVLLASLTLGCKNSCQRLCNELRDYAKECGYDFPKDQLQQCYADHKRKELADGETSACRDVAPNVKEEWTCDDFKVYFNEGGGGADTGA